MSTKQSKVKGTIQPDKIHIMDFKILHGQIESSESIVVDKIKEYEFKVGFKTGFNYSKLLVKADYIINVEAISAGKSKNRASASFHFVFVFKIDNLNDFLEEDKTSIIVSVLIGTTLASISHSTVRGILLTRFQGTALQHFILPVIDPKLLIIPNKNSGDLTNMVGKTGKTAKKELF